MKGVQPPDTDASRIKSWWAAVLAGQVDTPHPIYGADLEVSFKGGVLRLSGEQPSNDDMKELLNQAREFRGHGVDDIDAKHLFVAKRHEKPGILDQTLIAAFPNREVAEYASQYLLQSRRVHPKLLEILDSRQEGRARQLLPEDFLGDVQKAFRVGDSVLVLRVDETDAFKARELLDEETRSLWTIATPPTLATAGRA
jgi:hypothetical protein